MCPPGAPPVEISVDATAGGRCVEFRIAARGPGIRPEIRPRIFEPFFSTRTGGTGLGLAIALGIVRGHRGRILVDDREGGETCTGDKGWPVGTVRCTR